jgi:ABC-type Fe3+ transport system permease subunit
MRRLLTLALRAALVAVVVGVVRAVLSDRAPQRSLHGAEPVIGSLDTWPQVPRRATD